ncbi:MAG: ribose 5-phosphate isomerase B [Acidobacteriota bacterium]
MRIAIDADHAGFDLKQLLVTMLETDGHEVRDVGPAQADPDDDYPDAAVRVGRAIQDGTAERGLVICGSGVGASIAVNKLAGLRAGLCHDAYSARQGVEHDDVNVLCLGARIIGRDLAFVLVRTFLAARFSGEERHRRRLGKITALETGRGP